MKILAVSDKVDPRLYNTKISERYLDVDLVVCCGDLPYYYVEYLVDAINKPVVFVRGNHEGKYENTASGKTKKGPLGAIDLHNQIIKQNGLLIAGFEGAIRYRTGPFLYTQNEMWINVLKMVPKLLWNRIFYGRFVDMLVTHSPPFGIKDKEDFPHQGFKAFVWFLKTFKPKIHFYGHIHLYNINDEWISTFEETRMINAYGLRIMNIETW